MKNKKGLFSVKSAYLVAMQVWRGERWTKNSSGCAGKQVWSALWKLRIPYKIKVFGWRACHEILPTWMNLVRQRVVEDNTCLNCTKFLEMTIHTLWNCEVAKEVCLGSLVKLQKCSHGQADMMELIEYLLNRISVQELELFFVQVWLIWNQRNNLLHGGKLRDPNWLSKRDAKYLEEYRASQVQLSVASVVHSISEVWKPPPSLVFKLNFDATIFSESHRARFGAIIRNDKGEVMATMTAKGPYVISSDEAELLVCRKAIEFAIDARFFELVNEGDNANVMNAIYTYEADLSLLGNVVDDIRHLLCGLQWVTICYTRRGRNRVRSTCSFPIY